MTKELYFKRVTADSHIHQPFPEVVVGVEEGLSSLVDQVNVPLIKVYVNKKMKICCVWCVMKRAPVKVFDHAFQLLKFFHTKFVLLQQPDCACSDILTFAF